MRYELWSTSTYGSSHFVFDTYRWRWVARLVAWWRTNRYVRWEVREQGTGPPPRGRW